MKEATLTFASVSLLNPLSQVKKSTLNISWEWPELLNADYKPDTFTLPLPLLLSQVSDYPGGTAIIYGGYNRLHLFACEQRPELIRGIQEKAAAHIGISIKQRKDPITHDQFLTHKMGKYRWVTDTGKC